MIFCARVCGRKYFRLFSGYFIINFSRMCLRDQLFRVLLEHFISEVVPAQVTAGSNILGSFSAFCYKFCEKVTTGANV